MKSLSIVCVILLLASTIVPCADVAAQLTQIPHEDPSAAQSTLDSLSFLSQYAQILSLTATSQYGNASQLNEKLSHITVPDDLKYIVNRYSNLTQQLINVLQTLDSTLNTASNLLEQNKLDEAKQSLDEAAVLVAQAQIILGDLNSATSTISQRLGIFSASAASKVRDAYSTLQSMLQRLQNLIDEYHKLLDRAKQRMEGIASLNLNSTSLTMNLNATSCFVGSYLSASGVLTCNGSSLGNREIDLYLDGVKVASAVTSGNGAYSALIRIPYKYVSYMTANALYSPQSSDKDLYLGSSSQNAKFQVLFYETLIQVSMPSMAYPGRSLSVYGNVTSQEGRPLTDRQIRLVLDGQVIDRITTGPSGSFIVNSIIADQEKTGVHSLTVVVDASGLYGGASVQGNLSIKKVASALQISTPSTIFLPSSLFVNGTITSTSGPLADATVEVVFSNIIVNVKSLNDGSFNTSFDIPFSTGFVGNQELEVTVIPIEPWQDVAQKTTDVLVLNLVSIVIAVASSLSVVVVMYVKLYGGGKRRKSGVAINAFGEPTIVVPIEEKLKVTGGGATGQIRFEGLRGRVLKAYVNALNLVQLVTNESLMPNMTLREYLQVTEPKLGAAWVLFSDLTLLGEKSLYSPTPPQESEAEKAEELTNNIRRILNGRSA